MLVKLKYKRCKFSINLGVYKLDLTPVESHDLITINFKIWNEITQTKIVRIKLFNKTVNVKT